MLNVARYNLGRAVPSASVHALRNLNYKPGNTVLVYGKSYWYNYSEIDKSG